MIARKPRMGLLLLAAEWFWQQNTQNGRGRYQAVPGTVETDAASAVAEFFRRVVQSGTMQHWVVVHEDLQSRLEKLARVLDINCQVISECA